MVSLTKLRFMRAKDIQSKLPLDVSLSGYPIWTIDKYKVPSTVITPTIPVTPNDPTTPTTPVAPTTPTEPVTPTTPIVVTIPVTTPEDPVTPTAPTTPVAPVDDITPAGTPVTGSVTLDKSSVTIPGKVEITAALKSSTNLNNVILDIEVYDATGKQVYQDFETGKNIDANGITAITDWTPAAAGAYTVCLGVFNSGEGTTWGSVVYWYKNAVTITVEAAPTYVPTVPNTTGLYLSPDMSVDAYATAYPQLQVLANTPTAQWISSAWISDVTTFIKTICDDAKSKSEKPVFALYDIPNRDNGGYSAGGAQSPATYEEFIDQVCAGLSTQAIIILEPDATPELNTTPGRAALLQYAVSKLKAVNAFVYIDAGGPTWDSVNDITTNLLQVGIQQADGFSLNTSGFNPTSTCAAYGEQIVSQLASQGVTGKKYTIDTSRNGNGNGNGGTFNPSGTKIGQEPQFPVNSTTYPNCAGYLWVKAPGESDGSDADPKGGNYPAAGTFSLELALDLVSGNWS